MKKRPGLIKKLIFLTILLVVILGLIEGVCRLFLGGDYPMNQTDAPTVRMRFLAEKVSSYIFQRTPDPRICFELLPGGKANLLDQTYTINSKGFRGPEFSEEKSPGTYRILISGDSFSFGWGADDRWTIPVLMEEILKKSSQDPLNYEVINTGVPGYNAGQMKERLLQKGFALDPDLLILLVSPNDLVADYLYFDTLFKGLYTDFLPLPYAWKPYFWHASVAYRWVVQRHKEYMEQSGRVASFSQRDYSFFEQEVRAIKAEAEKRGISFLLIILPMLEDFSNYPYEKQQQDMHEILQGIEFVDLLPRMRSYDVKELWFRPEDHHLNRRANLAVARMILSILEQKERIRLMEEILPEDPLADALYKPGDLVVIDMDADPSNLGGFPGAVFKVDPQNGEVNVVSADPAFKEPVDLVFDPQGNLLVMDAQADPENRGFTGAIFQVDRFTGKTKTVVTSEHFKFPHALLQDEKGLIYISDKKYDPQGLGQPTGALMVYDPDTKDLNLLASGPEFISPGPLALAPDDKLYFIDADSNPKDYPGTPGVLFEVDRKSGDFRALIEFKDTVSPVGIIPLKDGRLIVIDANYRQEGYFLGGLFMVDPVKRTYELLLGSRQLQDPTRGDLGVDGCVYFTDGNADPLKLGPDEVLKGVEGTGHGAIMRFDYKNKELSLVVSDEQFTNPISLKVVPQDLTP